MERRHAMSIKRVGKIQAQHSADQMMDFCIPGLVHALIVHYMAQSYTNPTHGESARRVNLSACRWVKRLSRQNQAGFVGSLH